LILYRIRVWISGTRGCFGSYL